jgi:hypothetical protein
MALVRRGSLMGPSGAVTTAYPAAGGYPPVIGHAAVPRAAQPGGDHGQSNGPGPDGATVYSAGDVAAVPSRPASGLAILLSFGIVGLSLLGAYGMTQVHEVNTFRVSNEMSAFGALFVFSAAVERLLEPLSQWLPGRAAKGNYERSIAALANRHPATSLADVAAAKAAMERARANRTVVVWGLATAVSTVVASAGGFYLLRMLAESPGWTGVPTWIDALITGLVVGSGTKPLHDVISRVQKGKERAEDPAAPHA